MPDHVPPQFVQIVRDLAVAYQPRALERDTAVVYWQALGTRFEMAVLREAAQHLMRHQKFFPTVAEWSAMAARVEHTRVNALGTPLREEHCEWCGDRGLIRIEYTTEEPFDIAICSCCRSHFYRQAGIEAVRLLLHLDDPHRVALIEDFDEELSGGPGR